MTGHVSPLAGRIFDGEGRKLICAHTIKQRKRYRYYTSKTRNSAGAWRLPAGDVEKLVRQELERFLSDPTRLVGALGVACLGEEADQTRGWLVEQMAKAKGLGHLVSQLDVQVEVQETRVRLTLNRNAVGMTFGIKLPTETSGQTIELEFAAVLRKRGHELRFVEHARQDASRGQDQTMVTLLQKGWRAWGELKSQADQLEPSDRSELTRYARLRFLAPDIVSAILEGSQPVELTARRLMRTSNLPISWSEQREVLGFS